MVRLSISILVPAPVEKVYEHVTAFGRDGPVDEERFQHQYSEDIRRTADGYVYTEDIRRYPDDPEDVITWLCSFDYPSRRVMTAVDSDWSHRRDYFEPIADATRWTVQWSTRGNLAHGLIQYLFFKLKRSKAIGREMMEPVRHHFEAGGAPG
jgi:hypothetical protein